MPKLHFTGSSTYVTTVVAVVVAVIPMDWALETKIEKYKFPHTARESASTGRGTAVLRGNMGEGGVWRRGCEVACHEESAGTWYVLSTNNCERPQRRDGCIALPQIRSPVIWLTSRYPEHSKLVWLQTEARDIRYGGLGLWRELNSTYRSKMKGQGKRRHVMRPLVAALDVSNATVIVEAECHRVHHVKTAVGSR
ncbi:hypothetical protein K488DRAFT_72233 [Vararia minispora EC-137]|uniref:Uncharacterized protein n=1 Tax=Vararia minispora EC-137 TaxID=1314806 RepID=A0ACB8QGD2_9AGAM|nr:hypothetical protein K488DRAFT_72233 [Vararia minispora EC-137]